MYAMKLKFNCGLSLKSMNTMCDALNMPRPVVQNAMVITLKQTLPFIPNDETIEKYKEALMKANMKEAEIESVEFAGYDYLKEVPDSEGENQDVECL